MKHIFSTLFFLFLAIQLSVAQSVGLVMAGGGSKGVAHIGLIRVLEENDIPIDYVAGTSIGAIVAALYAMGYTPDEMMELIKSEDFISWQTGVVGEEDLFYFKKADPTPEMVNFKIAQEESDNIFSQILPTSLVSPIPMNFAFMQLFAPYTAQADRDFDKLFVPYRAVASDIYNKQAIVLRDGDLGDAVRASMTFPFLFKPIKIDDVLVYDGGIYNNFPVDVMKEDFAPDIIIGSNVSANPIKPKGDNLMNQIENMVMHKTDYNINEEDGILIDYDLSQYGLLDFDKSDAIYAIGYEKAIELIDSIKGRIPRRVSQERRALDRTVFRSKTPELRFDSVSVSGVNSMQQTYIKRQFQQNTGTHLFDLEESKAAYFKLLSDNKLSDLVPYAIQNPESDHFTLHLNTELNNKMSLGLGTYITSGNSNLVYLGAHYQSMSLYSLNFDVNGQVGRTYNSGMLSSRVELPLNIPLYLQLMAVYSNKKYYESETLFYTDELPTFIKKAETFGKLRFGLPFLTNAKTEISLGVGSLQDTYYQSNNVNFATTLADRSRYLLIMGSLRFQKNTLNSLMYPTEGSYTSVIGAALFGQEEYLPSSKTEGVTTSEVVTPHSWLQLKGSYLEYYPMGNKFTLGLQSEILISSKGFFDNYTSTMLQAPAFTPTPHSQTVFNEAFRSTQYVTAGVIPICKLMSNLQLRSDLYAFAPFFKIQRDENNKPYYGKFLDSFSYMGELSLVYNLSFASFSICGGYYSYPKDNWYFGVNLGILLHNPSFIE